MIAVTWHARIVEFRHFSEKKLCSCVTKNRGDFLILVWFVWISEWRSWSTLEYSSEWEKVSTAESQEALWTYVHLRQVQCARGRREWWA